MKKHNEFITEFKLDPRITSYKFPIIKMILCIIISTLLFYRKQFLTNDYIVEVIGNIVTLIALPYLFLYFFMSIIEIDMLNEKRRKAKRTLNDFNEPIAIPTIWLIDYIYLEYNTKLVVLINDSIVDIGCGSRSKRFRREPNVFNKLYFINDDTYYDEMGFEVFKSDLISLINDAEVKILFCKKKNYHDNYFKNWLENRDNFEDISFEMVDYDPSDSGDWRDVIINNTESEDNIH